MNSRVTRILVALTLGALAVGYGVIAYASYGIAEALTAVAQSMLGKPRTPAHHTWDEWFLAALSGTATLGAIGMFFRKNWSRIVSASAFGASALWAITIALAPESWRGVWFSTWVDRWAAALVGLLSIGGLGWFCSRQARNEFEVLALHGH